MKYLVILLLFVSCNAQKGNLVNKNNKAELEIVLRDNYSGLKSPQILVIKEPVALRDFYAQINKTRKPGLAIPNIDFNAEMIIIYCMGEQINDSAMKIEIASENSEQIVFKLVASEVTKNSAAMTSPFCVYKLNRTTKALNFIK